MVQDRRDVTESPAPIDIHGCTQAELVRLARDRLECGAGVAAELYTDVMRSGELVPVRLGLGWRAAEAWGRSFRLDLPEPLRTVEEPGPVGTTIKAVLRLADGLECECVSIPMGRDRFTLCVSSQVGCRMACAFCETARMGFLRDLTAAEIVGQLLVARHRLGWPVRNVVFMGMGEALDNPDGLVQALRVLTDGAGISLSQQRITVCTAGHVPGIARLRELGYKRLNLAISLNAATDEKRDALMPCNRRMPLAEVQRALVAYRQRRNFVFAVNYCLLPGLNDTPEDARAIARFCAPLGRVMINLIPYNPGSVPLARRPTDDEIVSFVALLRDEGLPVRRRIAKGDSVMAACGQLGNRALRARRTRVAATAGRPSGAD